MPTDSKITLGTPIYYYDEDRQPNAGWISHIFDKTLSQADDRPICNLATITHYGRFSPKQKVEPAYFDGTTWHLLNKWSLPGEVPETEWNYMPIKSRKQKSSAAGPVEHHFDIYQTNTTFPSDAKEKNKHQP